MSRSSKALMKLVALFVMATGMSVNIGNICIYITLALAIQLCLLTCFVAAAIGTSFGNVVAFRGSPSYSNN